MLLVLFVTYIALPVLTLVVHYISLLSVYPSELIPEIIVNSSAGVVLFFWFMNQFITGSRVKFMERSLGFSLMMKVHYVSTFGIVLLTLVHGFLRGLGSLTALYGFIATMIFAFVLIITVCFWIDTGISRLPGIRSMKRILDKYLDYRHYRVLHNLNALAAVFVFVHIVNTSLFEDSVFTATILVAYFFLTFGSYLYHKLFKRMVLRRREFELSKIIVENDRITTLVFRQKKGKRFRYIEGQFGFFTFLTGVLKKEEHPFSFSSKTSDDFVSITIQNDGDYTGRVRNELKVGDIAVLDGPYGHFNARLLENKKEDEARQISFIAGGIGITPFLSMMLYLKEKNKSNDLEFNWLYHSINDGFYQKVTGIASSITSKIHTFSRSHGKNFTKEEVMKQESYLKRHYFICASKNLTMKLISILRLLKIPKKQIHYELFSW